MPGLVVLDCPVEGDVVVVELVVEVDELVELVELVVVVVAGASEVVDVVVVPPGALQCTRDLHAPYAAVEGPVPMSTGPRIAAPVPSTTTRRPRVEAKSPLLPTASMSIAALPLAPPNRSGRSHPREVSAEGRAA